MKSLVRPAVSLFLALSVITGLTYPLLVIGIAKGIFPRQAAGHGRSRWQGRRVLADRPELREPPILLGPPVGDQPAAVQRWRLVRIELGPLNPALVDVDGLSHSAHSAHDVAAGIFWFAVTLEVVLSIGFAVLVTRIRRRELLESHFSLALSQRKDNWLSCAVTWIVVFSERFPIRTAFWLVGAVILAWLTSG